MTDPARPATPHEFAAGRADPKCRRCGGKGTVPVGGAAWGTAERDAYCSCTAARPAADRATRARALGAIVGTALNHGNVRACEALAELIDMAAYERAGAATLEIALDRIRDLERALAEARARAPEGRP